MKCYFNSNVKADRTQELQMSCKALNLHLHCYLIPSFESYQHGDPVPRVETSTSHFHFLEIRPRAIWQYWRGSTKSDFRKHHYRHYHQLSEVLLTGNSAWNVTMRDVCKSTFHVHAGYGFSKCKLHSVIWLFLSWLMGKLYFKETSRFSKNTRHCIQSSDDALQSIHSQTFLYYSRRTLSYTNPVHATPIPLL